MYLLASAGSEDNENHDIMKSQLAINMEEMELNPVLMQWASAHFSSVKKIATQHDKRIKQEEKEAGMTRDVQPTGHAEINPAIAAITLGKQNLVDLLHPSQGATHTKNKEGSTSLMDVGITPQAPSHATHTPGIQTPAISAANLGQGSATGSITGGTQNFGGTNQASSIMPFPTNVHG